MIVLTSIYKIDCETFDNVWYCTTTCPGLRVGCEHHPELAASREAGKIFYSGDEKGFYDAYVREMTHAPKLGYLMEVIRRSDLGEWFQLIFYERNPDEGERPYLYEIIKKYTDNVRIE